MSKLESNVVRITKSVTTNLSSNDIMTPATATAGYHRFLVQTAVDEVVARAGAGVACIGIADSKPAIGDEVPVKITGVVKVVLGATVASGAQTASDANGCAVAAGTGDFSMGTMLQGGTVGTFGILLLGAAHQIN